MKGKQPRRITLAHGNGGKAMQELIEQVFIETFDSPELHTHEDQARLHMPAGSGKVAFTTDSYVVNPLFFPGGNIGSLAVNGTVNDLAVGGAQSLYLSCGMIIEEGLPFDVLHRVVKTMRDTAEQIGVRVVTGDTKVVERGNADKLFINTSGVGIIAQDCELSASSIQSGDAVVASGYLGDHGAAILQARGELALEGEIASDSTSLAELMQTLLKAVPDCRAARDITRGGLASVLNEMAGSSGKRIRLDETALPLREEVRAFCEILGLDPLYLANEGALVAFVPENKVETALLAMRQTEAGKHACCIGRVEEGEPGVELQTLFGGRRIVDMLTGEQLPRIC